MLLWCNISLKDVVYMTENIKTMSKNALNNEDKFIKGKSELKNEDELKSPILIAEGHKRFFEKTP